MKWVGLGGTLQKGEDKVDGMNGLRTYDKASFPPPTECSLNGI